MIRKYTIERGDGCLRVMLPHGEKEEKGCVGEIYENTFVTKREPEKHVMRRWNAYGVNKFFIDHAGTQANMFDTIVFQEPKGSWMISLDDFLTGSRAEHIEGEEPQYFIDRDKLIKL